MRAAPPRLSQVWARLAPGKDSLKDHPRRGIILAGGWSLLAWVLLQWLAPPAAIPWTETMREAAREMARSLEVTGDHCRESGIPVDPSEDPTGTCLVGPGYSPLVTSLGSLDAKRSSLTPDLAGLLVHLLEEAGVRSGDTVGIGASGSFPGLLVATLTAVRAVEAHPVTILSVGASSYGATRPEFHLLDLHELLEGEGVVAGPPAAVSLGGEGDVGPDLPPELSQDLRNDVARAGSTLLLEPELQANVARRMEIYGRLRVFVNVGGAEANLGISPVILELPAGLVRSSTLPPAGERGVVFAMLSRGVPVLHLLHLRGLALRYGLPWDPVTPTEPGSTSFRDEESGKSLVFWILTVAYVGILGLLILVGVRTTGEGNPGGPPIR